MKRLIKQLLSTPEDRMMECLCDVQAHLAAMRKKLDHILEITSKY